MATDPTVTGNTDPTSTDVTSSPSTTPVALTAPQLAVAVDQADADYAPGETVGITATNLANGATVTFDVEHVLPGGTLAGDLTGTGTPWTITDGGLGDLDGVANGVIQTSWYVNSDAANQAFALAATDTASGATATTSFTDSTEIDLTNPGTATVNNTIFSTDVTTIGAGTGLIQPFVRLGNSPTEQGFNTDAANPALDAKQGTWTHSIKLTDIPIEIRGGIGYYRFELDINQTKANPLLSLDNVKIFQASSGDLNTFNAGSDPAGGTFSLTGATEKYNLDSNGDVYIGLNFALQPGSGNTVDMSMLVPVSTFDPSLQYVYLYSAFGFQGGDWASNDGFEEWNRQTAQVIDGHKFNDLNADHVWQTGTEPALNGWTVYIDSNHNGVFDSGIDPFTVTGTTDLNGDGQITGNEIGYYRFFVTPGTYTIREVPQTG